MKQFILRNYGFTIKTQLHKSVYATLRNRGPKISPWVLGQPIYKKSNYKVKERICVRDKISFHKLTSYKLQLNLALKQKKILAYK